jgi:Calcineurin-like phosphoesterase
VPQRQAKPKVLRQQMFRLGIYLSTRVLPIVFVTLLILYAFANQAGLSSMSKPQVSTDVPKPLLLTDPFLQLPTATAVRVVWFTEFVGNQHFVTYGERFDRKSVATTTQLSRTREDKDSELCHRQKEQLQITHKSAQPVSRAIWRHEAEITGLVANQRLPYRVTSVRADGQAVTSKAFTLAANPTPGQPLKILLTSDHQLKPMVAANLQKVQETIGRVDAVLVAGDLINIPDRASEWFDDANGGAFFPALQGRAHFKLTKKDESTQADHTTEYRGGELIQHAPLFVAIGNHEVMGRFSTDKGLNEQFNTPVPKPGSDGPAANRLDPKQLKDKTFNTDTYEEIFTLPNTSPGGKKYYAVTFGDIRLIVLYATNIWRVPNLDDKSKGKYGEAAADLNQPDQWGHGQFIFEPIAKGSTQFTWLEKELQSPEFKQAKFKVVMFHHPPHSLGENAVPAYTDPLMTVNNNEKGQVKSIRYEYPKSADYLIRDVVPLLTRSGVQLVHYGHSHLWNRFVDPQGMHFLETSNVGNSYGAYLEGGNRRTVPTNESVQKAFGKPLTSPQDYAATGNPNGLPPIVPTIAPLTEKGKPMPYIASNDITVFSILETGSGDVTSYYFDTRNATAKVIKFDQFQLKR